MSPQSTDSFEPSKWMLRSKGELHALQADVESAALV